jgi:hypothetical protein
MIRGMMLLFRCVFIKGLLLNKNYGGKGMSAELNVKQNTILCQECGEVIDTIDSSEGVKTWFGICTNCVIEKQASVID